MKQWINEISQNAAGWLSALGFTVIKILGVSLLGLMAVKALDSLAGKLLGRTKISVPLQQMFRSGIRFGCYGVLILYSISILLGDFHLSNAWFETMGLAIIRAVLVFVVGLAVIGAVDKVVKRALSLSKVDVALHNLIGTCVKGGLLLLLVISCVDMLGINTATIIAALSAVGLALSLSVKDNLSNLVGGVVVLFTKPFAAGDLIEMDGYTGVVQEIGLAYTTLKTFDNKKIFIPNNDAAKAKITNHSAEKIRRLDLRFSIGYEDDFVRAKRIILEIAERSGMMLPEPKPFLGLESLGASSVTIVCRFWVDWPKFYDLDVYMREQVKLAFDREGISLPYPQLDVHLKAEGGAPQSLKGE